jgi:glycosyltransferase involved in cell wall biosynthesis
LTDKILKGVEDRSSPRENEVAIETRKTRPTVTLVMPSHERGARIAGALDSVCAQTHPPDEVIVVNDGGAEATSSFVRARYPNVRIVDVPHGGAALARNRGADMATRDVLVFFDDDDVMRPHAIETLLGLLAMFPEARAAHSDHTFTNRLTGEHVEDHHRALPQFQRLAHVPSVRRIDSSRLYDDRLFRALLWGNLLQQPWAIYRETFNALGGFFPGLGASDDWDLYLRTTRTIPVALTDTVCSDHFVEKDKQHLTRSTGQTQAQINVLLRVWAATPWYDVRTLAIVSYRLGLLYRWAGDQIHADSLNLAWRCYLRAFVRWPFDYVVVARAFVLWPIRLLFGRGRQSA